MAVELLKSLVVRTKINEIKLKTQWLDRSNDIEGVKSLIKNSKNFDDAMRLLYSLVAMNYLVVSASCKTVAGFSLLASLDYYEILTGEAFQEENYIDFCGNLDEAFKNYVQSYIIGLNVLKKPYLNLSEEFVAIQLKQALDNPLVKSFKEDYKKFFEVQSLMINKVLEVFHILNNKEYSKELQGSIYNTYRLDICETVRFSAWNNTGYKTDEYYIPSPIQEAYASKRIVDYNVGVCISDTGEVMNNLDFLRKITRITPEEEKSYKTRYNFSKAQLEKARVRLIWDLEEERRLSCV